MAPHHPNSLSDVLTELLGSEVFVISFSSGQPIYYSDFEQTGKKYTYFRGLLLFQFIWIAWVVLFSCVEINIVRLLRKSVEYHRWIIPLDDSEGSNATSRDVTAEVVVSKQYRLCVDFYNLERRVWSFKTFAAAHVSKKTFPISMLIFVLFRLLIGRSFYECCSW